MSTIRQSFQKLQFKLNKLDISFRVAAFIVFYLIILGLWYWAIYSSQHRQHHEILQHIANLNLQNAELEQKRNLIISNANLPKTLQLLKEHESLKASIAEVQQKIMHYQHRFIDEHMLYELLHGLLKENPDIYIDMFEALTVAPPVAVVTVPNPKSPKTPSPPATATSNPKPSPPLPVASKAPPPSEIHYTLEIKGSYASILNFLSRIENLRWQLFWKKMDFTVGEYPNCVAKITFYTYTARKKPGSNPLVLVEEESTNHFQLVRDPVKPPFPKFHAGKVIKSSQKQPVFHLQSIVIGKERTFALINDQYVNVGDQINGGYVTNINPNFVKVRMPQGDITLYLFGQ